MQVLCSVFTSSSSVLTVAAEAGVVSKSISQIEKLRLQGILSDSLKTAVLASGRAGLTLAV